MSNAKHKHAHHSNPGPPPKSPTPLTNPGATESMPADRGTYYGQLSPGGQWFWNGTGLPGDAWVPQPSTQSLEVGLLAGPAYPPPFPTWPPSSGGYPVTNAELGPITNPNPYGSTQTGSINSSPPSPAHPWPSTFFPKAMPKAASGQNQGGSYQLPALTKPWEVGPIKASPSISAISPTPIMGPGAQGTPPY